MNRWAVEQIRDRVTVAEVLVEAGLDARGQRGRMPCPLPSHLGSNPSSFSWKECVWICHACGESGNAIDLTCALFRVDFKRAIEIMAHIAGVDLGKPLPAGWRAEADKQAEIQRRRRALHDWREARLNDCLRRVGQLTEEAEWLGRMLTETRARGDAATEAAWWNAASETWAELAEAEWLAAQLERSDEREWARLWLEEQRGGGVAGPRCATS